jgi:hypothetical protein
VYSLRNYSLVQYLTQQYRRWTESSAVHIMTQKMSLNVKTSKQRPRLALCMQTKHTLSNVSIKAQIAISSLAPIRNHKNVSLCAQNDLHRHESILLVLPLMRLCQKPTRGFRAAPRGIVCVEKRPWRRLHVYQLQLFAARPTPQNKHAQKSSRRLLNFEPHTRLLTSCFCAIFEYVRGEFFGLEDLRPNV